MDMKTELLKIDTDTQVPVMRDTRFVLDLSHTETDKKYMVNLLFEKEGVEAELIVLYKLERGDKLDLTTIATHKVPRTSCLTKVKGVLLDGSESVYVGKIVIEKPAQLTSSFLQDNVLVIGDNVINNSSPNLQIDANDVKASHGATTGRVSEDEVFYLTSRGLGRREAEDLIIQGFFEELLSTISDKSIRNKLYERLSYSR
ncbi:MAG TPA: SufD family Fe-S cluster assembly protein [Patescibacteria group bacterium]|nr:SufD family Fe-S cluster assembly protein [Patescibacteria group bacterium]